MTLAETIRLVEQVAAGQPAIKSIVRNDVFRLNTLPDAKYGVFAWVQGQHSFTDDIQSFNFTLFYVDRLTHDKANEIEVESVGVQVLGNIIRTLDEVGIYPNTWTAQVFNQRFLDECAGVYANITLQVPVNYSCGEVWPDFTDSFSSDFQIF